MPCQPVGQGRRGVVRAAFGSASTLWSSVAAVTQLSWVSYANSHPYVDALGQSIKLTGHQMFVAINANLMNCGQSPEIEIPTSDAVFAAGFSALTMNAMGVLSLTPTGLGSAEDFLLVAFSEPKSGGVSFCKTFRQLKVLAGNVAAATVLTTEYAAAFGSVGGGQRIFYRLTPVNSGGVSGTPCMGFITVQES